MSIYIESRYDYYNQIVIKDNYFYNNETNNDYSKTYAIYLDSWNVLITGNLI